MVTKVLSPALYKIKDRKGETVAHHDRLKQCNDRLIPLWMRRMRHDLLDLDSTIAYDEAEQVEDEVPEQDLPN